ncbi:hypothetical protein MAPG_05762 [Magnaporthiopsis poae ATCC 64411]|uniref:Uncharacterized protein n=1 Tax=Magnaporthiopsis poae (strain ATCC 64411 / 73-15) TaxID=644358 RepID=A0A0C4E096_MAGP6|nr:hypothetical protein MAPG_05762 [Magnaporthiopsis poae ATCC 64411]
MLPASSFAERFWTVALPSTKLAPVVIVASDPPSSSTNLSAEVFYGQKDRALLPSPHPAAAGRLLASFEAEYSNKGSVGPHDTSIRRRGSARPRLHRFLVLTGLLVFAASTPTPVAAAFFSFTAMDILVHGAGLLAATGSLAVPVLSLGTANQDDNVGRSCLITAYAICGLGYLIILFLVLKERAEAHDRRFFVLVAILAGFQAQTAVGTYGGLSGIDGLKVWGPLGLGFGLLFASVWTAIFGTGAVAIGTLNNQAV